MSSKLDISTFVAQTAYPFSTIYSDVQDRSEKFLRGAVQFAIKNKVFPLFYEHCCELKIDLPKEAHEKYKEYCLRNDAQIQTVEQIFDRCRQQNVDVLFIKTFKPFTYIPDDIDILLRRHDDLSTFRSILKEKGFSLLKIGTPELTMRKIFPGTYVDLDIHLSLSIGHVNLFDVDQIWSHGTYRKINGGLQVPVLPDYLEFVRESAYSLLKDFKITLPSIYFAEYTLKNQIDKISKFADQEEFQFETYVFTKTVKMLFAAFFNKDLDAFDHFTPNRFGRLAVKMIDMDIIKHPQAPYHYPYSIVSIAYLIRTMSRIHKDGKLNPLLELARQPSSKGIDILIDYIRKRPSII